MAFKRNIIANYLGQGWTTVLGLAFVPLYIKYLGVEAYGLIGLFAVMQAWLTLLDMGITPCLSREVSRFTAGIHSTQFLRDLMRSMEILCFSLASLVGFGIWTASSYLATEWLKADKIPTAVVAQAISVMAFIFALRFVEGLYRGSLFGLQKQVWYNGANAFLVTVRHAGALAILAWISPTIQAFFLWQAFISLLTVVVFAAYVYRALPYPPAPPKFQLDILSGVWKFAGGMMGISLVNILITQTDKLLLSRLLSLESFGYYTLSATVASIPYMVIYPITSAIYPHMVELSTQDDQSSLVSIYHQGAQLVTVLTAPAAMLLFSFAGGVVFMWSGNISLAQNIAPILSILVLGFFLNGLMWMPYQCQIAHGWTSLIIKGNCVGIAVLIPAIIWYIPRYGAISSAWIWFAVNIGFFLIAIKFMHRRLLPNEMWHWYFADVAWPTSGAIGVILLAKFFKPAIYQDRWQWFIFLLITGCLALVASFLFANCMRPHVFKIIRRFC